MIDLIALISEKERLFKLAFDALDNLAEAEKLSRETWQAYKEVELRVINFKEVKDE